MRILVLAFLAAPFFCFSQGEDPKSLKDGWAIHAGAGILYGGNIGLLIEDQISLSEKFRLSPFVAAGIAEGEMDSLSNNNSWFGYSLGLNLEYGRMHRLIIGPHLAGNYLIGTSVEIKKRYYTGLSLILGYKGTANFGLIWQLYIGDIYSPDPFSAENKYAHSSHIGLGLGYKF